MSTISPMSSSRPSAWSAASWPSCATPTTRRSSGRTRRATTTCASCCICHPALAPFKAAVLPLSQEAAHRPPQELYARAAARTSWSITTTTGSIGKRYRREDEIGTPFCITFDFETVGDENTPADHCVTVRERDTMQQVRMPISEVKAYLREKCAF